MEGNTLVTSNEPQVKIHCVVKFTMKPQGHSPMDKALTCHTGSWGSNQDTTKGFFNPEKRISAPFLLGTPAVYTLSINCLELPWKQVTCHGRVKERNCSKNHSSAICEANTDERGMYERKGVKKFIMKHLNSAESCLSIDLCI